MIVQENEDINNILFGYIHALLHPVSKLSISLNKSLCYMYYSIRQRDILNFLPGPYGPIRMKESREQFLIIIISCGLF